MSTKVARRILQNAISASIPKIAYCNFLGRAVRRLAARAPSAADQGMDDSTDVGPRPSSQVFFATLLAAGRADSAARRPSRGELRQAPLGPRIVNLSVGVGARSGAGGRACTRLWRWPCSGRRRRIMGWATRTAPPCSPSWPYARRPVCRRSGSRGCGIVVQASPGGAPCGGRGLDYGAGDGTRRGAPLMMISGATAAIALSTRFKRPLGSGRGGGAWAAEPPPEAWAPA